ncbi:hypothetical protein [Actinophytocola sp. NPDC049390]|uniref:hypothetical protein n=1 Tax=Actinophytocola sp. NPDC049390 TaxID=3363894 RepID=UPI003787A7E0
MNGQQHRDAINAELSGWFSSNTTQGTITGGSFAFTEDQIRAVVKNYHDLADSYDDAITKAGRMTIVEGPGLDFASDAFAIAANRSGQSLIDSFTNARDYCKEQARLAQGALDDYLGVENTNVTEINKQSPQGPQAGI